MSPYRIELGVNPRTPFSSPAQPVGRKHISARDYADGIAELYDQTVRFVRDWMGNVKDAREINQSRVRRASNLNVGDFVLVLRPEHATPGICR